MRFTKNSLGFAFALVASTALVVPAFAQATLDTSARPPKDVSFSFQGPFGTYDRAALQRGFQVYKEVCSACHNASHLAFHNLTEPGGPDFTVAQARALAASVKVPAGPDKDGKTTDANGQPLMRPATLADHFPDPFPNEEAARASFGGALPPDLSLIVKAHEDGPQFVYSILTGFGETPPKGFKVLSGKFYNPYFPGWNISMPPPLSDNSVAYSDGTKATVAQEAHDVATFLAWASEPKMDERKQIGLGVLLFLIALSGVLFAAYRKIWKDAH